MVEELGSCKGKLPQRCSFIGGLDEAMDSASFVDGGGIGGAAL
jgi:hypothetical protein